MSGDWFREGVTDDGKKAYPIIDFMTMACEYNDDGSSARGTWADLISPLSEHKVNLEEKIVRARVKRRGSRNSYVVDCMTLENLEYLLLILGGRVAHHFRDTLIKVLHLKINEMRANVAALPQQVLLYLLFAHRVLLLHLL
jgi:hypothetical protein